LDYQAANATIAADAAAMLRFPAGLFSVFSPKSKKMLAIGLLQSDDPAMKRTLTPDQIAARDERRAKFRNICKQVAQMGETERLTLAAKMPGILTCEGHELSFHNVCLLALQCPSATIIGGFRQWIKQGRAVMKGQHGSTIWAPINGRPYPGTNTGRPDQFTKYEYPDEPDETRFIMASVFDISQTQEIETAHRNPNRSAA